MRHSVKIADFFIQNMGPCGHPKAQGLQGGGGSLIFGVVGGSVDSGSDRLSENVGFHGSVNH